ncbi:hypothetical protein ACLUTX_21185 [Enterobacterales bacterium AE_CKDN230030158-1A_HGKHYDSX7]
MIIDWVALLKRFPFKLEGIDLQRVGKIMIFMAFSIVYGLIGTITVPGFNMVIWEGRMITAGDVYSEDIGGLSVSVKWDRCIFRENTAWWNVAVGAVIKVSGVDGKGNSVSDFNFTVPEYCSISNVEPGVYKLSVSPVLSQQRNNPGLIEVGAVGVPGLSTKISTGGTGGAN